MKGAIVRSRSMRGMESPQRDRDSGSGLRQKSSPVVDTLRRRVRNNSENLAPSENVLEVASPVPCKPSAKGSKTPGALRESTVFSSPALMPKLPKPSPARSIQPLAQNQGALNQVAPLVLGPDQGHGTKRKLNLDMQVGGVLETVMNAAACDPSDTGVKVIVRMRPLNKKEAAEEATLVVQKVSSDSLSLADQQFTYDAVAGENETQQAVFNLVGLPMVENCLAGFNSSIFAYGQTGSGKTHTMWGPMPGSSSEVMATEERGITPRVFEQLFARIQQEERNNVQKQLRYQCRCSFLEIYNEQITDLLEPSQKNLLIREDTKTGVYVESLTEEYVSNLDDVTRLLIRGLANRRTGSTAMNNESSRSHSVFTFVIESRSKSDAEGASSVRTSRMNLVDLAGSERQKQTGAAGERLKEAGNINKSLSQLGNVINILAEVAQTGKHRHIPYRDSRLTFLLQESLGGNAKLAMICAVSPASSCKIETLSTLRFAQRAKAMQNKAVVNEETANDVNLLREQIRQLKEELMRMKANNNQQEGGMVAGITTGWNARRSYNLLRLSLGQPMTIPASEIKEIDKDVQLKEGIHGEESGVSRNDTSMGALVAEALSFKTACCTEQLHCQGEGTGQELSGPNASENAELAHTLIQPTLSISPNVKESKKKEQGADCLSGLPKSPLSANLRDSKAFASSTDQLAASLTRGIEILESHQRNSMSQVRGSAGVQFAVQNGESPSSTRREAMLRRLKSSSNTPLSHQCQDHGFVLDRKHGLTTPPLAQSGSPSAGELSPWPQITLEDSCKILTAIPPVQNQRTEALEALLASALRRERAAQERLTQRDAEIEQLNRLVCQYKLERECNAVLQQSREEKIARMECLMDSVLPTEEFQREEWTALQLEHKMLQEKFDHHPELAEAKAHQELLQHQLEQYRSFYDLGERKALQEEIMQLQNQLTFYLETGTEQRRLSLDPSRSVSSVSPVKLTTLDVVPEVLQEASQDDQNEIPEPAMEGPASQGLLVEHREREDKQKDLLSLVQELREERDHNLQLAEKRKKEVEGEKRCSQEIQDALQMAMAGHARLLDQYAELQEKHITVMTKLRNIRDGVDNIKTVAKKAGLTCTEDRWFDTQATQIIFMKVEQDQFKQEIKGLQAQLRDTADALQAAGELVVRLKDAEQAAAAAKEATTAADQNICVLRRELEIMRREQAEELTPSRQHSLDLGPLLCSVCGASTTLEGIQNDATVHTLSADEETAKKCCLRLAEAGKVPGVIESWSSSLNGDSRSDTDNLVSVAVTIEKDCMIRDKTSVLDSWSSGKDEDEVGFGEDDGIEMQTLSKRGYQFIKDIDADEFEDDIDDDEFLCEICALPATNGLRVCDLCV